MMTDIADNEKAARRQKISHALMWIFLLLMFFCFVFPFFMVIINVFKSKADIVSNPLALVGAHGFTLKNFPEAMKKMKFWTVFTNSFIITCSATVLTILVSSMMAFVIVRNGRWKFCTLILMHVGFSTSMAVFMFHGAIKTNIPLELEEAATIDGCTRWQTWWKVVFPLLKPTIATVGIINAMAYWNDYLLPSLVLTKKSLYTIPIATQAFYGTYSTDIGLVMAALLLAMLPILILYLFLQRYIVEGVTAGGVKG